jgi:hypothetical protein
MPKLLLLLLLLLLPPLLLLLLPLSHDGSGSFSVESNIGRRNDCGAGREDNCCCRSSCCCESAAGIEKALEVKGSSTVACAGLEAAGKAAERAGVCLGARNTLFSIGMGSGVGSLRSPLKNGICRSCCALARFNGSHCDKENQRHAKAELR